ncbi:MAG: MBOAT family protein [Oscillospiraceae bacterium]|nr:MBOAT family protein [Oscillospiraceae bacterium]
MEFSNLYYLFILLPMTMLVYFLMPNMHWKNMALLGISMLFYAMGQPLYLIFMIGISYLNYKLGLRIRRGDKWSIALPVAIDLLVLGIFKYLDFFLSMIGVVVEHGVLMNFYRTIIDELNTIGFSIQYPTTVLPIGISFYIFSMISYLADVYMGTVKIEKDFRSVLLCWLMYPQLLMGPIVRYEQVQIELHTRKSTPRMIFEGIQRFTVGLAEKVLLADYCGQVIRRLADMDSDTMLIGAWLSAIMFTFQLYFDFCGYSNMAIGLGRIFGFRYCENFDLPYISKSITEFWRRWHMSLGTFFRDYVYIPLGGNRKGKTRQILNMLVVWALTGLWHGASWNFVLWGIYNFVLLTIEKQIMPQLEDLPDRLRNFMTMLAVLFGWVLFSHTDFAELGIAIKAMLGFNGFSAAGTGTLLMNALPLIVVCIIGCTSLPKTVGQIFAGMCGMRGKRRKSNAIDAGKLVYVAVCFGFICLLLWLSVVSMVGTTSTPSIYADF